MKILAIIPARAGSKRVPNKNKKLLAGKPLIAHTIHVAKQSQCCDQIVVSTDGQEIADIALQYGATVPWLRPRDLAADSSDVIHAVMDLIERYQSINTFFDSVILLQPTSPFRKATTIQKAVEMHQSTGESVVSVNRALQKPSWYRVIDKEGNLIKPEFINEYKMSDFNSGIYVLNGAIYIASVEHIMAKKSFYNETTKALILDNPSESIDIDTFFDWELAEKLIELKEEVLS